MNATVRPIHPEVVTAMDDGYRVGMERYALGLAHLGDMPPALDAALWAICTREYMCATGGSQ